MAVYLRHGEFRVIREECIARLSGKVAMVTGSGGEHGLGRAVARRLAADGADPVLTDIVPRGTRVLATKVAGSWGGLEAVAAEIRGAGRQAMMALLDIRSARQIETVIAQALERFERIDILVNNAAAPPGADRVPVVELSEEAWDAVLDVTLKGSFLCAKAVALVMLRQKTRGRIINIASDQGKVSSANLVAYCTSKFGLIGFTQALAMELAPAGITVDAVCPGGLDTERLDYLGRLEHGSYDAALRGERVRQLAAKVPIGRSDHWAGRGIGRATAAAFASEGYAVIWGALWRLGAQAGAREGGPEGPFHPY